MTDKSKVIETDIAEGEPITTAVDFGSLEVGKAYYGIPIPHAKGRGDGTLTDRIKQCRPGAVIPATDYHEAQAIKTILIERMDAEKVVTRTIATATGKRQFVWWVK